MRRPALPIAKTSYVGMTVVEDFAVPARKQKIVSRVPVRRHHAQEAVRISNVAMMDAELYAEHAPPANSASTGYVLHRNARRIAPEKSVEMTDVGEVAVHAPPARSVRTVIVQTHPAHRRVLTMSAGTMAVELHAGHMTRGMNAIPEPVNMMFVQQTRALSHQKIRGHFFAPQEKLASRMLTAWGVHG